MSVDLSRDALLAIAAAIAAVATGLALLIARRARWAPVGGIALLAATPAVPLMPIALGFSLDDILPILGLIWLLAVAPPRNVRRVRVRPLLVVGLALMIGAGMLSAIVHAMDLGSLFSLAARSAGRFSFLAAIGVATWLAVPAARRRTAVAVGIAVSGVAQAAFGLVAFAFPGLGVGLEPTKSYSVLYFEVPGRLAGSLGISPNFLGAIFIMSILLAAGLALDARGRRWQMTWWSLVGLQTLALVLTFTRASLGVAIVGLVALVLSRGRLRYLVPVALAIVIGFAMTPALQRLTGDMPDRLALWSSAATMMLDYPIAGVGPGRSVIVAQENPERYVETAFGSATNSAHNTVLIAGAETGVPGAIGSLAVNISLGLGALALVVRSRRRHRTAVESAAGIAVLGYLAQGVVNNLFNVASSGALFALLVGAFVLPLLRGRRACPAIANAIRSGPSMRSSGIPRSSAPDTGSPSPGHPWTETRDYA